MILLWQLDNAVAVAAHETSYINYDSEFAAISRS